jgi:uncharacterized protein
MSDEIDGFDWDDGNRHKCRKHGVAIEAIEGLFRFGELLVQPDAANSKAETRFRAIGRTADGRSIFVIFTMRGRDGKRLIRPISARFMHQKEITAYEKENP